MVAVSIGIGAYVILPPKKTITASQLEEVPSCEYNEVIRIRFGALNMGSDCLYRLF